MRSQAVNRSSFLSEKNVSHTSVSQGPPPAFLVQTPLGTPHEETIGLTSKADILAKRQQEGRHPQPPTKIVEQVRPAQEQLKQRKERPNRSVELQQRTGKNGNVHRWFYQEVRLSMSKMSIMSLVLGLLFLGALFFIIGFLAAVATLKSEEKHNAHSAWEASNSPHQGEGAQGEGPHGGGKLGHMAARVGGAAVGGAMRKELAPLGKVMGSTTAIVPAPLQPFARYGIGAARNQVRNVNREVNPFATRRRMPPQAQQPYGVSQQQPGMAQQYPVQQPQPYPQAAMQGGYPQPTVYPQGGQGYGQMYAQGNGESYSQGNPGYAPVQQQPMMMQQPEQQQMMQQQYYQQPMQQQMAPQQMMPQQQMIPQQQIMQQPQYPQQMGQQPGY